MNFKSIAYKIIYKINVLKLRMKFRKHKTIAVFFYFPMHQRYVKSTLAELKAKGYIIHFFIPNKKDAKKFDFLENDIVESFFLLESIPYKVLLTPATDFVVKHRHPDTIAVHMFHSIVSSHVIYPEKVFAVFDVLFCVGPHHFEELNEMLKHSANTHYLAKTGYEITDNLKLVEKRKPNKSCKPTILYSPSWGVNNSLKNDGKEIVRKLMNKNYKVILRPHPISLEQDKLIISSLVEEYKNSDDFVLDDLNDSTPSFILADAMISDYSGVAFEYSISFKKPVLFVEGPRKINNNNWESYLLGDGIEVKDRSLIGYVLKDLNTIENWVEKSLLEQPEWERKIELYLPKVIYNYGNAGYVAANDLNCLMQGNFNGFYKINK